MSFPVCKQKGFGMFLFRNLFYFLPDLEAFVTAFYKLQFSDKKECNMIILQNLIHLNS